MRVLLLCGITAVWSEPIRRTTTQYSPHRRDTPFTWDEAQALCQKEGQTLATVSSLEEQETLAQLLSEFTIETSLTNQPDAIKYWIGLKRPERVNKWTWRNEGKRCNPPVYYWGLNEPPGIDGGDVERNCVAMEINDSRYPNDQNWATFRCDIQQVNGYVCQTVGVDDFCSNNEQDNQTDNEDSTTDIPDPDTGSLRSVSLALLTLCTLLPLI